MKQLIQGRVSSVKELTLLHWRPEMTTTSTAEHPEAALQEREGRARRSPSSPTVETLRADSHAGLTDLVSVLGYPPHWADELERRAFAAGRAWSFTPGS